MNIKCLYGFHDGKYLGEHDDDVCDTHTNKWYRCKRCGHKYFKTINHDGIDEITNTVAWLLTSMVVVVIIGVVLKVGL
jgi:hypothetical protein